jgi:hypothetical protein
MESERVAHGTLRAIRGHGVNIGTVSQRVFERREPLGLDPVIVRDQDDHDAIVAKKRAADKGAVHVPTISINRGAGMILLL